MVWIFGLVGLLLGTGIGWLLPRKKAATPPPLTEREQRQLREFQRFLSYDGFAEE